MNIFGSSQQVCGMLIVGRCCSEWPFDKLVNCFSYSQTLLWCFCVYDHKIDATKYPFVHYIYLHWYETSGRNILSTESG